jgi:peptide subunit release factor 1 (eRF1)
VSIVAETSTLESTVRTLAGFQAERAPVVTIYLDVDGRRQPRHQDVVEHLGSVVRQGLTSMNGSAQRPEVLADLRRIEEWVRRGFDRSRTRGLAVFACGSHDLFEVVELPMPVRDRIVVNHAPAVGQLESVIQDHEPIGVLLADKLRARMFVFELGELRDRSELFEAIVTGEPGHADRGDLTNAIDAAVQTHLRHAAAVAWRAFQERPYSHLVVGGPDPIARELESTLHPYLQERLAPRIVVPPTATLAEIRDAAVTIEHEIDRRREAFQVERLRAAVASGRRGVAGLAPTLQALNERRVERLLVSDGYLEEGWRCPETGALAAVGPTSPTTGGRMERVDDVVEDAVEAALNQDARVDICVGNADLDVLGRIGAILRY